MVFTLTHEHLSSLLDPVREGNLESFLDAISPRVEWSIGASNKAGKRYRGPHSEPPRPSSIIHILFAPLSPLFPLTPPPHHRTLLPSAMR